VDRVPLVLAHRGARKVAPENTIEAFSVALDQGADGVELDVHRTADDGLVVHHDADAPGLGVLAERTLAEIRAERPEIPTLDEVLDTCAGSLVNVEIKNLHGDADFDPDHRAADLVVQCLARRDGRDGRESGDRVLVSSFNLDTIDRVRAIDDTVPTGFLIMGVAPMDGLEVCVARGHQALHPFVGLVGGDVAATVSDRARELGVRVNVWTVNDDDEVRRLADVGVDALITDVPDRARRALGLPLP
jgi:glycerophosphoryl diester phosphodiesterase